MAEAGVGDEAGVKLGLQVKWYMKLGIELRCCRWWWWRPVVAGGDGSGGRCWSAIGGIYMELVYFKRYLIST